MVRRLTDRLLRDARDAARSMLRTPGFTIVAVLMLALGTGANAAMFSVIDAVVLRSPFVDPDRVALVRLRTAQGQLTSALSLAQYRALTESAQVFDALAAMAGGTRPILTGLGDPRRFNVECVTAGMFRVLGTPPALGRTLAADDDRPDAPAVVVLSDRFWRREMGAAADVLDKSIRLNGVPATIVGVMPRGFGGPLSRDINDGWMPGGSVLDGGASPGCVSRKSVSAFVRVKSGLSFNAAARQASDAAGISRLPDWRDRLGGQLELAPLDERVVEDVRTPLLILLGAVGLVLLIACANVANLQMERIFGRRVELGVRMALGATRARMVSQTMVENLLLAALGGLAGLLCASGTLHLLVGLLPAYMPRVNEIELNVRVLVVTIAVACVGGLGIGLIPALQGASTTLMDDLRASTRTSTMSRSWTRRAFVVAQIALSLVLVVGATLMIATFRTLRPATPGFNAANKLTASLRPEGHAAADSSAFFNRAIERVRALPGVRSVEGSTYLPMSGMVPLISVRSGETTLDTWSGIVTPGYFAAMEIPVVRGRAFSDADTAATARVAIINEAFVRKWWPGSEPLGKTVDVEYFDKRKETRVIVGVLRDTRSLAADLKARPEIYTPLAQTATPSLYLVVRADRPADPRVAAAIRGAIATIDPTQVVERVEPMQDMLDAGVATWRFGAWLLGLFAAIALLLAAVGLAASIAWWVAQRSREIGVRMALGASPRRVTGLVVSQGLGLTLAGVIAGLAGARTFTRLLQGWLFGISPLDRPTFAACAAGMLVIAALATYVPVRRATRIDPLVALRE